MGASLLIFLNKTDVEGCMTVNDIHEVRFSNSNQPSRSPLNTADDTSN
jgi:hypothetical protein